MHILVVEDSPAIARFLQRGLSEEGHRVVVATDLESARDHLATREPQVIIVDRMLPDGDGLDLVRELRRRGRSVPAICLTARERVDERVEGLRSGADDYLVKPFSFEELLARIEAVARRAGRGEMLRVGPIEIDIARHRVSRSGRVVELTAREFDLLVALARHPGRVLSRTRLLDQVWQMQVDPGTNRVDVYVGYLRKKLGSDVIRTVRGVGYVMDPEQFSDRTSG
ncbi:MAG: DNA-binding response regulator [Deltaproteobacteria bacterium]|nr:MAG: DNA-binding response regulator [Deltaproteobacteria bacterium]